MDEFGIDFFKQGLRHNAKNAAYIDNGRFKKFHLNGEFYGFEDKFTKESWRRLVKLKAFL